MRFRPTIRNNNAQRLKNKKQCNYLKNPPRLLYTSLRPHDIMERIQTGFWILSILGGFNFHRVNPHKHHDARQIFWLPAHTTLKSVSICDKPHPFPKPLELSGRVYQDRSNRWLNWHKDNSIYSGSKSNLLTWYPSSYFQWASSILSAGYL